MKCLYSEHRLLDIVLQRIYKLRVGVFYKIKLCKSLFHSQKVLLATIS